ncbi:MAG: bifunctional 5-dehydro-2-deoxygluconokinase/5-dehydro-2-deoxyphosphogluconate aldolase [Kiloniellales bacterium]
MKAPSLDVIAIGRSSVDLYGQQIGCRLEDVASFAKAVGGCPANIAVGCARLGLKAGLVTRVGDEQMGRFLLKQLKREGVEIRGIVTDPERLTALVLLGVRDDRQFPTIFYRENCADMALTPEEIDEGLIASAGAVVVTGTHFSRETTAAAQKKAIDIARRAGRKVVFDIDYRPSLWGLAGHAAGFARFVASKPVTAKYREILPLADLIVGTEEEICIAGGKETALDALAAIRARSKATLVLKRGPMGCTIFPGPIPERIDDGIAGPGFPVEVYNVLGAGDAFMAGFLRGWLKGEKLETCATWANACGAIAVSRLLCSPEYATWAELRHFLKQGAATPALRNDEALAHLHWATTREGDWPCLRAFAIDHRSQLEDLAERAGAGVERIADFKRLAVKATAAVAQGRPGFGILLDGGHGRAALFDANEQELWIGRPIERPGSRPLVFETGEDLGAALVEWPRNHTVKCLCFYHPDDPPELKATQEARLLQVHQTCRRLGREYLLEIIASKHGALGDGTVAAILSHLYALGLKPDWWKLEPQPRAAAWQAIDAAIAEHDPLCRGVVLLGLEATEEDLASSFAVAAQTRFVRGFAVGRTLFAKTAETWLAGRMSDEQAVAELAERFARLAAAWDAAAASRAAE